MARKKKPKRKKKTFKRTNGKKRELEHVTWKTGNDLACSFCYIGQSSVRYTFIKNELNLKSYF